MASDPLWNHVQTEIACPFAKRLQEKWDAAFCLQVSTEQTRSYPVAPGRSACSTGNVSSKLVVDTSHVTWVRQVRVCSIARQPSLIIGITKIKEAPNITQPAAGGCRKDVRNSPQRLVHFFWLSRGPDHPDVIEALLLRLLQNPTFSGVLWTVTVSCALNKHAECLQCGKDMSHSKLSSGTNSFYTPRQPELSRLAARASLTPPQLEKMATAQPETKCWSLGRTASRVANQLRMGHWHPKPVGFWKVAEVEDCGSIMKHHLKLAQNIQKSKHASEKNKIHTRVGDSTAKTKEVTPSAAKV